MNANQRPTLEELSFYYDGLLEGEAKERVEAYLRSQGDDPAYSLISTFDRAVEPELSDQEIDDLLANNVQDIHNRIFEANRQQESGWLFFLQPKFIGAAICLFILVGITMTYWDSAPVPSNPKQGPMIAQTHPDPTPDTQSTNKEQSTSSQAGSLDENSGQLDELQKQMVLAMTDYAKSSLSSGMEYATEQGKALTKQLESLQSNDMRPLALDAVKVTLSHKNTPSSEDQTNPTEETSAELLAKMGKQQVALGIGASMMTLINVF